MISLYTIKDYIKLITNKRRHFYYVIHRYHVGDYVKKLAALNKVLKMLRGFGAGDLISVNADGGYMIQKDITTVASGCFNCDLLGGMQ